MTTVWAVILGCMAGASAAEPPVAAGSGAPESARPASTPEAAPAPAEAARAPGPRGLLVCADPGACDDDRAWVGQLGGGGPGGFDVFDLDEGLVDASFPGGTRARWEEARAALRAAVDGGRWAEAVEAGERADEALGRWTGTASPAELFELWMLRGVAARSLGRDEAWQLAFRQAAAVSDGAELPLPAMSAEVRRSWLDEQRKLLLTGRGSITLAELPADGRWYVDGRAQAQPAASLLPGTHRVTVIAPGFVRSWRAEVPVLPQRESVVRPRFAEVDDREWLRARLDEAFTTLVVPESVGELLADWCAAQSVTELRLMKVDDVRRHDAAPTVTFGAGADDRPAAAAGEPFDAGDGVPLTYEGQVAWRYGEAATGRWVTEPRLRVVFFDPRTRRLSVDSLVPTALAEPAPRLWLGVGAGWLGVMERRHLGASLRLAVPLDAAPGALELQGELGLVHADEAYNLYPGWVDRELPRLSVGASWGLDRRLGPVGALRAEVFAPTALGLSASAGLRWRPASRWRLDAELSGLALDKGLGWGATLGAARGF